ncbi:carboxymethylenebutenolidase [Vulcanimicrobium alpinum]|uniref:Carboxymethylenebutenolidase n=1 Tax=Vulcanimicrobium alpinum TaxID=3016050 RepID=A0AAN2C8A2_UNVUL|nr:dienelactone hydrolase family protein [Vulcanimicrobium alpinum]BDE04798.1 carboxymethylenebutenolidase [Vulcanimicrobium alpinum]
MKIDPTDPLPPTKPEVSRRGFVALGAGAAAGIANAAAAGAQTDGFGKPHPPIVAEDDPAIAVSRPTLQPKAGTPIGSYAAMPRSITRLTPGVVVIQAASGVDPQLRDVVRRLAKAGFIAIAPSLFDRVKPPDPSGIDFSVAAPIMAQMSAQGFVPTDVIAAHDWLQTQAKDASLGIIGFCMGGGIVLQSIIDSHAFSAASMFYGNVRPGTDPKAPTTASAFDFTSRITTPLLGSFGARDTSIKPADVTAMFARLTAPHAVKIYDEAGHAFFDDTRDRYIPSAAADAWARTLDWFRKYLT